MKFIENTDKIDVVFISNNNDSDKFTRKINQLL